MKVSTKSPLDDAIEAHGGLDRWRQLNLVSLGVEEVSFDA